MISNILYESAFKLWEVKSLMKTWDPGAVEVKTNHGSIMLSGYMRMFISINYITDVWEVKIKVSMLRWNVWQNHTETWKYLKKLPNNVGRDRIRNEERHITMGAAVHRAKLLMHPKVE